MTQLIVVQLTLSGSLEGIKAFDEIPMGSPQIGVRNTGRVQKIVNFDHVSLYQ